jgi:hypothetical protein
MSKVLTHVAVIQILSRAPRRHADIIVARGAGHRLNGEMHPEGDRKDKHGDQRIKERRHDQASDPAEDLGPWPEDFGRDKPLHLRCDCEHCEHIAVCRNFRRWSMGRIDVDDVKGGVGAAE